MSKKRLYMPVRTLLLLLLLMVMMLTAVVGFFVWKDYKSVENRFWQDDLLLKDNLHRNLDQIDSVLSGFVALHNSIDLVDVEQFSYYAQEMLKNNSQLYSILQVSRVEHRFKKQFIYKMKDNGFPTYQIYESREGTSLKDWKQTIKKTLYYPISAVEPLTPETVSKMGHDVYSVPVFRKVIDLAIRTGKSVSTGTIKNTGSNEEFLMVFKPVYAGRMKPTTEKERMDQTLYLIAVTIKAKKLALQSVNKRGLNYSIFMKNNDEVDFEHLVYRHADQKNKLKDIRLTEFNSRYILNRNGQSWLLVSSQDVGVYLVNGKTLVAVILVWSVFVFLIFYIINTHYARLNEREISLNAWKWEKERADVTLMSLADAVITTNTKCVVEYMNPVAERLTGWKSVDACGRGIEDVFVLVSEVTEKRIASPVRESIQRGVVKESDADVSLMNRNNDVTAIDYSVAPMYGQNSMVLGAVVVFQDVGSSRMMSKLLTYQATHDDLTGLYNRREFERRMSRIIERIFSISDRYVLLYMDLDQFKVVNDTCGHVAGDLVLRQIAELIKPLIKNKEIFARLGGDEFGILLEGYTHSEAVKVAETILEAVRKYRFQWTGKVFEIGVSIGIVEIDSDMQSISNIMGYADAACYLAKDMGGNHIQVYKIDDEDYKLRKDQMQWVQRITQAFADSRFVLYAQKIVSLQGDSEEEHYEILMRMLDDNGNIIVPQEYIVAAERYRSMKDIDRWVVRNAFININNYVQKMMADPSIPVRRFAINLSGQSISSNSALKYVKEQLLDFPLIQEYVIFEITETAAISNLASAQRFIDEFKGMGVKFSLDDFGTGVSSFNYLKNLSVDYLKIDGGFVREMISDVVDYAMVKSIAHIGHVMGIKTIAEHAETKEICEKLKTLEVDYAQGFILHKPEKLENFT